MGDLILNPKSNRYVKTNSQVGRRLLKHMRANPPELKPVADINPPEITSEPKKLKQPKSLKIQNEIVTMAADEVANDPKKFKNLTDKEVDKLFKKLLLERLNIMPDKFAKQKPVKSVKSKKKFKVVQPSSSSESESD